MEVALVEPEIPPNTGNVARLCAANRIPLHIVGMPGFRLDGKMLVWFGAAAHHCSFFPGATVSAFKNDLKAYKTSKGTIRFDPAHPLPATLVRKIVKARIKARG